MEDLRNEIDSTFDNSAYYARGMQAGMQANFSPQGLVSHFDELYDELNTNEFVTALKDEKAQEVIAKKNRPYNVESEALKQRINGLNKRIEAIEASIEAHHLVKKSDEILDPEIRKRSFLPYMLASIILVGLTLFLLLFYASTGFSIIFGVPETGNGLLNPAVFQVAFARGGSTLAFVTLFPILFIAVGFATYIALERNAEKEGGLKGHIWLIILVTLIADMLIGYQITKGLYLRDLTQGLHVELWSTGMAFSDANFYFVFFMGFAFYLVWGYLLNYVVNHPYRSTTNDYSSRYAQIEMADAERERLITRRSALVLKLNLAEQEIQSNQQWVNQLNQGKLPCALILSYCKPRINAFLDGFQTCIRNAAESDEKAQLVLNEIQNVYASWLKNKCSV